MDIIDSALHTIATSGAGGSPSGAVIAFAGATAPSGWQLCYGQAISRATYSDLFTVIGTTYGSGDGSTTFNVPDLRGRVTAGKDNMGGSTAGRITAAGSGITGTTLGAAGGSQTHTLTEAQLATHDHTASATAPSLSGLQLRFQPVAVGGTPNSAYMSIDGATPSMFVTRSASSGWSSSDFFTISGSAGAPTVTVNNAGSGSAHNNTQPTIILNYIIKE